VAGLLSTDMPETSYRSQLKVEDTFMAFVDTELKPHLHYRDGLRGWLDEVQRIGELLHVNGAHWDTEMGSITQMLTEKSNNTAPAILFDEVPGYPKGFRTLYGHFSTIKRVALTLGLPLEQKRKVDIVQQFHARMQNMKAIPPRFVKDGPILQNVMEGDACDVLKFPVPRHHEQDKARFIGTADCVVTQDPDKGWFNLGAYRSQVYDGKTVGCQITEGKHGRIHRDIYFERGQPMKVVILCGQDPLLFLLSGAPMPDVSEYDLAGGLRGEPIDVIRGPYTGFPIPADCEIAIEGETVPGQTRPEGHSKRRACRTFLAFGTTRLARRRGLLSSRSGSAIPVTHARRCISLRRAKAEPMPASGMLWSTTTSTPANSIRCCGRCAHDSTRTSTSI
jgi:hypothetical protein